MPSALSRRRFVLAGSAALLALPGLALAAPASADSSPNGNTTSTGASSGGSSSGNNSSGNNSLGGSSSGGAASGGNSSGGTASGGAMPRTLTGPVSGTLAANRGGTFDLYQFNYAGDNSAVILTLSVDQPDALRSGAAGVGIYRDGSLQTLSTQSTSNTATAIYSSTTGGPVVVQVFNYDPVNAVTYTLTAQGLPGVSSTGNGNSGNGGLSNGGAGNGSSGNGSTAGGSGANGSSGGASGSGGSGGGMSGNGASGSGGTGSTAGASTTSPRTLTASVSGRLIGNTGGAYDRYQFTYPGDGSTVQLTLTTDASTPLDTGAVGVDVYQGTQRLTTSSRSGPFQDTAIFTSSTAGLILVEVFDFDPTRPINYTLTATGLPRS